jgi:hypothetical protein
MTLVDPVSTETARIFTFSNNIIERLHESVPKLSGFCRANSSLPTAILFAEAG